MAGGMALAGVLYADLGGRAYAAMALAAALGGGFVLLARKFVGEQFPDYVRSTRPAAGDGNQ
jgi:hypothetical protein